MALTPEQKAAHERLDEAIKDVLRLQGTQGGGPDPTLVDWMVVAEGITWNEDGDSIPAHNVLFRGGQCRLTVALGLLEVGAMLLADNEEG